MDNQMMAQLKVEILQVLLEHVAPQDSLLFLFGSMATHTENAQSDVDIGYLGTVSLSYGKAAEIRDNLNEKVRTLRHIDFVDFTRVRDMVFRHEVSEGAVEWYRGKDCSINLNCLKKPIAG